MSWFLKQEVDADNNTLVVVLGCDATELHLLLTFMYTGEVTASKRVLPSLLRLAQTLKVSGLTDAETVSTKPLELSSLYIKLAGDHRWCPHRIRFFRTRANSQKSLLANLGTSFKKPLYGCF